MLSSFCISKPFYINKSLQDYCKKCNEKTTRILNEKYNLERNKEKIQIHFENNQDHTFFGIFLFLSITFFSSYFLKRIH